MKSSILTALLFISAVAGFAKDPEKKKDSVTLDSGKMEKYVALFRRLDSMEKAITYTTGMVKLEKGNARIQVPKGFKFIPAAQARYIIEDLWQNLPDDKVMGMIVTDSFHVNQVSDSWAFIVSFDKIGYVKDDDADKISYDELLKQIREDEKEANIQRMKLGYSTLEIAGWAQEPYYDKKNKVLYWAKEFKSSGSESNTLNYDIRILGRNGVLSLNAVADMSQLEEVKKHIPSILGMAQFDQGSRYADFDSSVDEVAAWTIGGLVAGKILAKAGFLALILKFWKIILLAMTGAGSAIYKFFGGKRKHQGNEMAFPGNDSDNPTI